MLIALAQWVVILFGMFLISVGFLMLINPEKARATIEKAGSTNLINYGEITLRMIPAIGLILYADASKFPEIFKIFGWFMLATSLLLYLVPRRLHHAYAVRSAKLLKPHFLRLLSPLTILFGCAVIYSTL